MTPLALDTETALIKIGLLAPPLTCVSWADGEHVGLEWVGDTGPCYRLVRESLETDTLFIGLNIAYDFGVIGAEWPNLLPLIFAAYESDRVTDVGLRQKLIDIAKGQFRGYTDGMTEGYTSHEYPLANGRFARCAEPENPDREAWLQQAGERRRRGEASLPSTIGNEKRSNPFLRCDQAAILASLTRERDERPDDRLQAFAALRRWKDGFQ